MKNNWLFPKQSNPDAETLSGIFNINKRIIDILHNRGIVSPEEIENYISPRLSSMHSPFLLSGMIEAVERIRRAIDAGEKIGIFADSDLDGLTSLTILHHLFKRFSVETVYRFPLNDESYGLSRNILREFIEARISLLITVDSGIRDVDEIAVMREHGIDVIITDHHEPDETLPEAVIINPKLSTCPYPYKNLAGVGVAFKLGYALLLSYLPSYNHTFLLVAAENNRYYFTKIKQYFVESTGESEKIEGLARAASDLKQGDYILHIDEALSRELSALTEDAVTFLSLRDLARGTSQNVKNNTVSVTGEKLFHAPDIQPGDRRTIDIMNILFQELQMVNSPRIMEFIEFALALVSIGSIADVMPLTGENRVLSYHGLRFLGKTEHAGLACLVNDETVSSKTIGWDIAPLLNTPGRFGKAQLTADFFLEENTDSVLSIISSIRELNDERKNLVAGIQGNIEHDIVSGTIKVFHNIAYVQYNEIPDGLAGLIANRIADILKKPVIVTVSPPKNGCIKGSGRSVKNFNMLEIVERHSSLFERLGGHSQAFGFSIREENLEEAINRIVESAKITPLIESSILLDAELSLNDITSYFIKSLSVLEPYGKGNEEPVFLTRGVEIAGFSRFGQNKNHGRFTIKGNTSLSAIGWSLADKMEECSGLGNVMDLVYTLELNSFRGSLYPRMILVDMDTVNDEFNQFH